MPSFPVLPPTYYHTHFTEMLTFVRSVYADVLGPEETAFAGAFDRLSLGAQCLFIRMINRKRPVFTLRELDYPEIDAVYDRLDELKRSGFVRPTGSEDYRARLNTLTRNALDTTLRADGHQVRSQWSKARLIEKVLMYIPYETFARHDVETFVPEYREITDFLLFLYFGKLRDDMTAFTLRDLGLLSVRAQTYPQTSYQARFISREEARDGYAYTRILRDLKALPADERLHLAVCADALPEPVTPFVEDLRDRLMYDLGRAFERHKDHARALNLYARSNLFESQERTVRLLYAQGDMDEVRSRLETMLDAPVHDEAFLFADDFYKRKFGKKRTSAFTDLMREGQTIAADDLYRGVPELAAIRHYEAQGWRAHHVENGLWPALFALLFWDELFEQPGALASEFDRWPQALRQNRFASLFPERVAQVLDHLEQATAWPLICDNLNRFEGRENALFQWTPGLETLIRGVLENAHPAAVRYIVAALCHDFNGLRDGFPDLVLIGEGRIAFIEVKGDGDQVRRHQLARLNLLRQAGFTAGILRVTYRPDPDQVYVIVDIETTGGQSSQERVTEIGAVKMRNGEIIDRWHSLINPERRIPAFITDLTGISNEMVKDAPRFAEIADDFETFLKGAVFVAHNVNFDYGFLSAEYRRLERSFRYPKLCTVASMRRYFPGLPAYGLAPLSRQFGIDLTNHHRAMSDAMAASELLKMVNEKRLVSLSLECEGTKAS